jgi:hypothetical protein
LVSAVDSSLCVVSGSATRSCLPLRPVLQGGVHRVERWQRASVQRPLKERHEQTVELLLLCQSRSSSAARLHDEQMVGVEQPSHAKTAMPAESLSVDHLDHLDHGGPQRDR